MHEMAIVESIMEILEQQAALHRAKRVVRVYLEFGAMTAVLPTAVEFAFNVLSNGTVAEGAELYVKIIPLKTFCTECEKEIIMDDYDPFCPLCKSPRMIILEGRDEMRIASLEIEDS